MVAFDYNEFCTFLQENKFLFAFFFLPSPVDEKEVAELKKKEAARSNHPLLQHEHDLYEECQNFRQRWRLVALVREADTEAEETARKEKLEVNFNTIVAIFISFIVNIVVIFIIANTIITIATRRQ